MGFFSGIGKVLGKAVSGVADVFVGGDSLWGKALDLGGQVIGGLGAEAADSSAVANQNRFNAEQAAINRNWQANQANVTRDFNALEAAKAREFNAGEAGILRGFEDTQARRQMDFQERMRATQYQTAVADMRAAGINPMVAFSQGGAGTPAGASASGSAASGPSASASAPGGSQASASQSRFPTDSVTSAMNAIRLASEVRQVKAMTANTEADTANKLATAANIEADTNLKTRYAYQANTQGNVNQAAEKEMLERVHKTRADTEQSLASAENIRAMNLAVKELASNPATRPFAAILQLLLKR